MSVHDMNNVHGMTHLPDGPALKKINILGIVSVAIMFTVTVVFNSLAGALGGKTWFFKNSVGNLSDKYETDITPAGWTFSIWSLIYTGLAIAVIWAVFTLFSKNCQSHLLYTPLYSLVFTLNLALNLVWIFIWDREQLVASSVVLFLIAITNIVALGVMARNMAFNKSILKEEEPCLYWFYIAFFLNIPAIYTTWTVIASLLNLGIALQYVADVPPMTCSMISLTMLALFHCTWFILENTLFDRFVRMIVTPYLVVIWALCGIFFKKKDDPNVPDETKYYITTLLVVATVTFVARVILIVWKQVKKPIL